MKYIVALILALVTGTAFAGQFSAPSSVEAVLNNGFGAAVFLGTEVAKKKLHVMQCQLDFSKQGGSSAAAINLRDLDNKACVLPKDAIIMSAIVDVLTPPTSGATLAEIAIGSGQSATDIKGATVVSAYTSGLLAGIPVHTAATAIKLTANRTPKATVTVEDLTAGKINVLFEYLISK